jgi:hypothetical protein
MNNSIIGLTTAIEKAAGTWGYSNKNKMIALLEGIAHAESLVVKKGAVTDIKSTDPKTRAYMEAGVTRATTSAGNSNRDAKGIMQLTNVAWREVYGVNDLSGAKYFMSNGVYDVAQNVEVANLYFKKEYDRLSKRGVSGPLLLTLAVAAYNAGGTHVGNRLSEWEKANGTKPTWAQIGPKLYTEPYEYVKTVHNYMMKFYNIPLIEGAGLIGISPSSVNPSVNGTISAPSSSSRDIPYSDIEGTGGGDVVYQYDNKVDDTPQETSSPDFFKLGDVVLRVPPQAISMQESNAISTMSTVRTKGSPKINTGQTESAIVVEITFPSLDDINGFYDKNGKWNGGLRGILAEFFRTPFVPLENQLIRKMVYPDTFNSYEKSESDSNIFLDSIATLNTVADDIGRDDTAAAETIRKIGNVQSGADSVKKILEREKANTAKTNKLLPRTKWKDEIKNDTRIDEIYKDRQLAVVLDSFNVSTVPGFPNTLNMTLNLRTFNYDPYSTEFAFIMNDDDALGQAFDYNMLSFDPTYEPREFVPTMNASASKPFKKYYRAILREWQEGAYTINGEKVYEMPSDYTLLERYNAKPDAPITLRYMSTVVNKKSLLAARSVMMREQLELVEVVSNSIEVAKDKMGNLRFHGNYVATFFLEKVIADAEFLLDNIPTRSRVITALANAFKINEAGLKEYMTIWDNTDRSRKTLEKFLAEHIRDASGEKSDVTVKSIKELASKLIDLTTVGEDVPITETIVNLNTANTVVTGMTASYSNKVTPIQIVGQRDPTFQYMGGSDVSVNVSIQTTNEDLISELRRMALMTAQTQMIAQMEGLTGALKYIDTSAVVECDFFQMLGIRRVSVTDVTYSNVQDHPGLYDISMQCIQSDFDLKKYESLVATKNVTEADVNATVEILRKVGMKIEPKTWISGEWDTFGYTEATTYEGQLDTEMQGSLLKLDSASIGDRITYKFTELPGNILRDTAQTVRDHKALSLLALHPTVRVVGSVYAAAFTVPATLVNIGGRIYRAAAGYDSTIKVANKSLIDTGRDLADVHKLYGFVRAALGSPNKIRELNSVVINARIANNNKNNDANRLKTTCYPDMYLPTQLSANITNSTPVPPDFYFKREEIGSVDTINQELNILNQMDKYKLMMMLSTALKESSVDLNVLFVEGAGGLFQEIIDIIDTCDGAYRNGKLDEITLNESYDMLMKKIGVFGNANTVAGVGDLTYSIIDAAKAKVLSGTTRDCKR